jgi:uncharacterized alkaline shock family protein YloU
VPDVRLRETSHAATKRIHAASHQEKRMSETTAVGADEHVSDGSTIPAQPDPTLAERATAVADRATERAGELVGEARERIGEAADAISGAADRAGDAITEATQTAMTRMRNNADIPSERGLTSIANEVVEKIAGIAAREVPGVYDLGGDIARMFSGLRERLHLGEENRAQGIGVRLQGRSAEISVTLVLEYGFVVSSVTDKVREKIISSVETLLELDVTSVDILVDDIHIDADGPVGDDVARAADYDSSTTGVTVGTKTARKK